jgi:isoleucyl-tRNA synthetase
MDHITVYYQADEKVSGIFEKYGETIMTDVLGHKVVANTVDGYQKEWNINGENVLLGVKKE